MKSFLLMTILLSQFPSFSVGGKLNNKEKIPAKSDEKKVPQQQDMETVVCNQYNGQEGSGNEAMKRLEQKLERLIRLVEDLKLLNKSENHKNASENEGLLFASCREIYDNQKSQDNKAYVLQLKSGKLAVYCHMSSADLVGCGGGGWMLVMKIDGHKPTFHFKSELWTNKVDFNLPGGKTGFDSEETKLPTYWETPFSKICLAMKIGDKINSLVIYKQADSVYSMIADGKYRATSLGRQAWKGLIGPQASLQTGCNKEGFNVVGSYSSHAKARIGYLGNNQAECSSCDSRIGFGTGGLYDETNTCGNEAMANPDNGEKHIKAMGYILVQ